MRKTVERTYFDKSSLIEFIIENLESNYYVTIDQIDEFYLKYSKYYQNKHFNHRMLLFGYENDCFYGLCYNKESKYKIINMNQNIPSFHNSALT
jgi:hypothetical protein